MLSYCSKCEKETYNVCAKKTSYDDDYQRCAECFAHKSFFDKVKDKHELEVIASQFLTDFL